MAKASVDKEETKVLEGAITADLITAGNVVTPPDTMKAIEPVDVAEELVKLTIPIDYSRPFDTQISIQVNGQTVIVQRGIEVTIKRKFAEAYNNAEMQRGRAIAMMYSLSNDNQ